MKQMNTIACMTGKCSYSDDNYIICDLTTPEPLMLSPSQEKFAHNSILLNKKQQSNNTFKHFQTTFGPIIFSKNIRSLAT
jgi:hypothetical protein